MSIPRVPIRVLAFLLLVIAFCVPVSHAQQGTVRGQVTSAETGGPLPRANVFLRSGERRTGTSTDSLGTLRLRLSPGEYRLEVSALGYRGQTRALEVQPGQTTRLALSLGPKPYSLNEIVVEDQLREGGQSTTTIQRVEAQAIERQDATDVSDLAALVPATHVQTNSRGQTILYFRNAGDRQVGQFFDGALLNIPWDNRVDISLIPASVIQEITVTKGVPSVRYGSTCSAGPSIFSPGRSTSRDR